MKNYSIALAGNPNVGKSTIFNALTGLNQHTGNWAGKTVTHSSGNFVYKNNNFELIDLPGTYSLISNSEEEEIARNYICSSNPDCIIVVVDGNALERNLNLALQILELTNRVVVCVNLLDEATKNGISINIEKLESLLKVPVVGCTAKDKKSLDVLYGRLFNVCKNSNNEKNCKNNLSTDLELPLLEKAEHIAKETVTYEDSNFMRKNTNIDKILTSKVLGIPIMLCFLGLIFWLTITFANYPSQLLSQGFAFLEIKLIDFFSWINAPEFITNVLVLGCFKTLGWVIAVMLPPMAIFFPLFTLLEDLGYLPRIAFNLDNCFRKACASGKQALTMCMGFGCNAAGVIGCRIIDSPREKLIAILTNAFVPCNGRFPFLIIVASIFFSIPLFGGNSSIFATLAILGIVLLGIFMTLIISKILSSTLLKGVPSSFVLELPPFRKPQIISVLVRSIFDKTLFVLGRAIVVAAPAGIVIWLLANISVGNASILSHIALFLDPLANLMGLDGYILAAFIIGIPANEIVLPIILMGYLSGGVLVDMESVSQIGTILANNGWTILTAINVMIFILLHFPCATTLLTIKKETNSIKWTVLSFIIPTACGILLCMCTTGVWNLVSWIL